MGPRFCRVRGALIGTLTGSRMRISKVPCNGERRTLWDTCTLTCLWDRRLVFVCMNSTDRAAVQRVTGGFDFNFTCTRRSARTRFLLCDAHARAPRCTNVRESSLHSAADRRRGETSPQSRYSPSIPLYLSPPIPL